MQKTGAVMVLILLLAASGAGAEAELFEGDLKSLKVDDKAQVTASISNPLPIGDDIRLTMKGSAVTGGPSTPAIIGLTPQTSPSYITCSDDYHCTVTVPADGEKDVNFTITADHTGQGVLVGVVNSSVSDLTNQDELDVRVESRFVKTGLSAPGLTLPHLIILSLLSGILFFLLRD